jgi:O-antigen/teichoic acid export membrane protein
LNPDKSTDSNDTSKHEKKTENINQFVGSSFFLFLDQSLVAISNWLYWLAISKVATIYEIGQATTIYSLIILITTVTQLGLEYPLLKKSSTRGSRILGTTVVIELVITMISMPIAIYIINNFYHGSLQGFTWLVVVMLVLYSLYFVSRFGLLGVSDAKSVLIIDVVSTITKFAVGYTLVFMGFGAFGIVLSLLLQFLIMAGATFFVVRRILGFRLGNIKFAKEIIKDGLINAPSKFSRMLVLSLSVVLLAALGTSILDVSRFYLALMVSVVVAGLASSMAFMVIPASSRAKTDLSSGSMRIGLSLTAPLIAALIVAPKFILSIIGAQYISAETTLLVLSISIFPLTITINAISQFNNLDKSKKLVTIGCIEITAFLLTFFFLTPQYGILGSAFSILIAFICSAILSMLWSERILVKYIAVCGVAITAGIASGYMIDLIVGIHPLAAILTSIGVTMTVVIALKNTSAMEIRHLIKATLNRR